MQVLLFFKFLISVRVKHSGCGSTFWRSAKMQQTEMQSRKDAKSEADAHSCVAFSAPWPRFIPDLCAGTFDFHHLTSSTRTEAGVALLIC